MRRKIEFEWQFLDEFTKRVKVIGGWLVQHGCHTNKGTISESMVFIADRDHEWIAMKPAMDTQAPKVTVKAADFEPK